MKITPKLAAVAAFAATLPVAALAAASVDGVIDQGVAYLAATLVSGLMSVLAAAVTRFTGAKMDENARGAIQTALENGARLALRWIVDEARDLPVVQRIEQAIDRIVVPYVEGGNADSLQRFGMDQLGENRDRLRAQAEAHLIEKIAQVMPQALGPAAAVGAGIAAADRPLPYPAGPDIP